MNVENFGNNICKFGPLIIATSIILAAIIGVVFAPVSIADGFTDFIQELLDGEIPSYGWSEIVLPRTSLITMLFHF